MFTPFRDGLQSSFGGKVRLNDFLPAMKRSVELGIRHFEFGGGARYQAPYFYLGEDPFEDMKTIREAVGPEADLQILTRSVSGVTLTTQSLEGLADEGIRHHLGQELRLHERCGEFDQDRETDYRLGDASPGMHSSNGASVQIG
jgi:pyruvate/oxaloacetate carboxyltransferase